MQIYEQASRFARVGAGIQMAPNAMKVLRGLGLEERLREIAFEPEFGLNRDFDTGATTNKLVIGQLMQERYGAPYLLLHRADLHAALVSLVPSSILHLQQELVDLQQDPDGVTPEISRMARMRLPIC